MLEQVNLNAPKMAKEEYKPIHDKLIDKLVVLQQEARRKSVGLVVLFEGWSGAGKGSRISDLMYELDARATTVHVTEDIDVRAAAKFAGSEWGVTGYDPLMREFWKTLGERGTITFYDRGWYTTVSISVSNAPPASEPSFLPTISSAVWNSRVEDEFSDEDEDTPEAALAFPWSSAKALGANASAAANNAPISRSERNSPLFRM